MGLLEFFKNRKYNTASSNDDGTHSVFRGDLATVSDMKDDASNSIKKKHSKKKNSLDNKDSIDSVVFMTFGDYAKFVWYCPECGTASEGLYDGCVVCGLKR